ncbi:MAG: DUF1919 domain-containing protein [Chitinophagaceae bacterium]
MKKIFKMLIKKASLRKKYVFFKSSLILNKIYIHFARQTLKNKNFSIISNNCWGGSVYEDLNLSYLTPTVGLFFFSECYMAFITDLENNLRKPLSFSKQSKYTKGNYLLSLNRYPIGLIDGTIEIHFLHYKSEEEALSKWQKRAQRVNFNNLFFSFTDNEAITEELICQFDEIPYPKVFFSSKVRKQVKCNIQLKDFAGQDGIGNLYDNRWLYRKHFNVVKWLNSKQKNNI